MSINNEYYEEKMFVKNMKNVIRVLFEMKVLVDMSDNSDLSKTLVPRGTSDSNRCSNKYDSRQYIAKMVV